MIVSLNEIDSAVVKAARGAGYAWGLAEDAAKAARWLAAYDLVWLEPLLQRLEPGAAAASRPDVDLPGRRVGAAGAGMLDPLVCGAVLSDLAAAVLGQPAELTVGPLAQPILLLPFLARVAFVQDVVVEATWTGARAQIGAEGIAVAAGSRLDASSARSLVCRALEGPAPRLEGAAPGGREVDDRQWQRLGVLAARTYVPASEASRIAGAGAGLSDND